MQSLDVSVSESFRNVGSTRKWKHRTAEQYIECQWHLVGSIRSHNHDELNGRKAVSGWNASRIRTVSFSKSGDMVTSSRLRSRLAALSRFNKHWLGRKWRQRFQFQWSSKRKSERREEIGCKVLLIDLFEGLKTNIMPTEAARTQPNLTARFPSAERKIHTRSRTAFYDTQAPLRDTCDAVSTSNWW